ncbi:MAG: O-antigen ligase family protein, partial [Actinobacteria bacterium]|nr:O-antigen ligase family protein [Actinomycetota bacterium]
TLGNSNYNGAYLGISFPFLIYLALVAPRRWLSALILATAGFACMALWQTSTRGGMLALVAGVAVMAIGLREELASALKRTALSKGTLLLVISALLLASAVVGAFTPDSVSRISRTESIAARLGWWSSSVELIADHPWFGTGFNTFYASVLPYGDQPLPQDRNLREDFPDEPHNIFLSRAAGSGVPALVAYLRLVGSTLFFALRRLDHRPRRDRLRTVAFTAVLVAYLTQGFFSIDVIGVALMGWTAIAALAALSDPLLVDQEAAGQRPGGWIRNRKDLVAATLAASILLMGLGVPVVVADAQARKAHEAQGGNRSAAFLRQAIRIHPLEPEYRFKAGKQLLLNAMANDDPGAAHVQYRQAVEAYRNGLDLQPEMVHEMVNLTIAYTNWAVNNDEPRYFHEADRWFDAASELDPFDYEIAYRRSENLRIWARTTGNPDIRERQIAQLQRSISLYRDQPKAWVRLSAAHRALGHDEKADAILREYFDAIPDDNRIRRIIS